MSRSWYVRCGLIVAVLIVTAYLIYPSYFFYFEATQEQQEDHTKFCDALPAWATCKKFSLGLDLQGGVHLVMGVRVDKAVEQRSDRVADALRESLQEEKIAFLRLDRPRDTADIVLTLSPDADVQALEKFLRKEFSVLQLLGRQDNVLTLGLVDEETEYVEDNAVEQAIKTIRNRADKLGVTEPTIAKRGNDSVLIQLPGVKDPERAIALIGRTAQLQFHIVDAKATHVFDDIAEEDFPEGVRRQQYSFEGQEGENVREVYFELPRGKEDAVRVLLEKHLSGDRIIGFGVLEGPKKGPAANQQERLRTYVLYARPGITGDYLRDASVQQDPNMPTDYYVSMSFDTKGAKIFEHLTEQHVRQHMAIVLDGKVNSAPVIQEKIGGGTARITLGRGMDSQSRFQEAKDLALVLKAGALPAPVELREKREVGRSLGEDAVKMGSTAFLFGALLILLCMALYYSASGLLADLALTLNIFLILAALTFFEATLTLPGIAGILLTSSMAVDANVLIFERIREELRVGKTVRAAIEAGYAKAWRTIFDSNITTLLAGIVLLQYGSGPIRGFAVTLIIGILCSMFTAITVTRLIFDFFTGTRRMRSLSI